MPGLEAFLLFTRLLDDLGLPYFVTGSVASIVYGEPRMTHDIDIVLSLGEKDIERFLAACPEDSFYAPPAEALRLEVRRDQRGHFNLIHHASGNKADVYLLGAHPLHSWAISNRRQVQLPGEGQLWIAPPEYVILRKLEFLREGGSQKHKRDIQGILEVSGEILDNSMLQHWIERLGISREWAEIVEA